ncbi:hypothetical protein FLJC2902T_08490 [Flavobacterium limnosediminis JC2902]|uniref:Uncharacterized protein n=1 Tax=Flavobacterium limnosediminis JC2902 TaxID=1341181 RepID=V6SS30_9FLAO|nr:hypothetical protein [Flavobacterium limnosediminis]ESU29446.1 hypothetical protein FLJC2902T_08490 [Flavobacterium limnosediminis JC2902]
MKDKFMYPVSIGTGIIFWITLCNLTDQTEAWDSVHYYTIGLPVFMLINLFFGYIAPNNAWKWGALSTMAQLIPLILMSEPSPFWAVGVITFVIFSIPAILAAMLGSKLSKKKSEATKEDFTNK